MFARLETDPALVKASRAGSTDAFEVLVGRYQSVISAITYSATGRVDQSEELAQEVFLHAWKSLHQLKDLDKFRAWLCSIARSTVQNWFRRQKQDVVGKAAPLDAATDRTAEQAGPEETAMTREQEAVVAHALAQIPEVLREPLVLFYREQKSTREVAEQLGLSENAARQRISRGRSMLREQVAAMIETTVARTKPGKVFTRAVIAAVGAAALETGTATLAVGQVAASAGGSLAAGTVVAGLGAKLATIAAGVVIVAGGVLAWRQFSPPAPASRNPTVARSVSPDASLNIVPAGLAAESVPTASFATATSAADQAHSGSGTKAENGARTGGPVAAPPAEPSGFQPRGVLSGLVTDVETGAPVKDAVVRISMRRIFDTRTDANGFYCFEEIHQPGNYEIAIDARDHVGIAVSDRNPVLHLREGLLAVKHFQLPRACMVSLRVVDVNGVGTKDTAVVATLLADDRRRPVSYFGDQRRTDPNGYLLLGGFPPADTDYLITAWHEVRVGVEGEDGRRIVRTEYDLAPGKATVRLTDPDVIERVQIVLEPGRPVHGYAEYADGLPASDIQIVARPSWWHCNYGVQGYPVGADGTFILKHVTPEGYDICAHVIRPDFSGGTTITITQAQLPPPDGAPLIVRLAQKSPQALAAISGRFVFSGDKRPDSLHISAYSPTGGHAYMNVGHDPRGRVTDTFLLDRLEPGTYRLTFSGSGVEDTVLENIVAPASDLVVELACATKPVLTGEIVDARTGEPVRHFRVRARKLQTLRGNNYVQPDQWTQFEDEHGGFSIGTVGPGVYQVQAVAEGYAPAWSRNVSTDSDQSVTLALTPGGAIAGRVVDAAGRAITGARVIPLSIAGGTMPSTKDVFVSDEGATETVGGAFKLLSVPVGTETLKVTHPDYAFRIVADIPVGAEGTTDGLEVVLTRGGAIEGYVYDERGAPVAGEVLYVQDQSAYGGSDDEEAGRLGVVITDSNGFYRLDHLPEGLCHVKRRDEWKALGVVKRGIVPRDGQVVRVDFGGAPIVSGSIVIDGTSLAGSKLFLGPESLSPFGTFACYVMTDQHGGFAFGGVPPGTYAIGYARLQKSGQWVKIATVSVRNEDVDVGVLSGSPTKLFVTLNAPGTDSRRPISQVFLGEGTGLGAVPLRRADAPPEEGKPWVISDVEPGHYTLMIVLEDSTQWRQEIDLEPGRREWHIPLNLLQGGARLSGRIVGDGARTVALWRQQKDVLATIDPSHNGSYAVEGLPAGHYLVGNTLSMLYGLPAIAEFDLAEGQSRALDLDLSGRFESPMAMLTVQVVDHHGALRTDARIRLTGPLGIAEPLQSAETGHLLISAPGEHLLRVEVDGCKPAVQNVVLRAIDSAGTKPQIVQVHLQPG